NEAIFYSGLENNVITIIKTMGGNDSVYYNQTFIEKLPTHQTGQSNFCIARIDLNGSLTSFKHFGAYKPSDISFLQSVGNGSTFELALSERKSISEFDITQETFVKILSLSAAGAITTTAKVFNIRDVSYTISRLTPRIHAL